MRKSLLAIAVVVLFIGLITACDQNENTVENEKDEMIAVETVEAVEDNLIIEKKLYGRTAPIHTTPIIIEMPGELETLEVENGDLVEEDDLIATLKTPAGIQEIKAPKSGEIIQLEVEEGDIVSDAEPFAIVMNLEEIRIDFTVTSNLWSILEKDHTYTSIINDQAYETNITSINPLPNETGLYPIEAMIKNKNSAILPGMIAVMFVPEERIENAIILPTAAIIEEADGSFVYVIQDGRAVKKEIVIMETQSDQTAIEGEINKGDQVVINGQFTLENGSKVNVVKEGNES